MTKAKRQGVGQGVGGGRPRREASERVGGLGLSKEAARTLRDFCKQTETPIWRALDDLILGAGGICPTALGIAKEAAAWLAVNADSPEAPKRLQEAFKAALLSASPDGASPTLQPMRRVSEARPSWMLRG
jgi:hypothetical protein